MSKVRYGFKKQGKALLESLMPGGKWDDKIVFGRSSRECELCRAQNKLELCGECPIAGINDHYFGGGKCSFDGMTWETTQHMEEFYIMMGMLYHEYFV